MDPKYYGVVEMLFSFGVVLAFGFWQLHSVSQAKKRRARRRQRGGREARASRPRDIRAALPLARHPERQHQADDRIGEAVERKAFVHRFDALAEQRVSDKASRIERRVLEGADSRGSPVVRARRPGKTPARPRQSGAATAPLAVRNRAWRSKAQRERQRRFAPSDGVVEDRRAVAGRRARPGPAGKRALDRLGAGVLVEIACPAPAKRGRIEVDRDARARREGRHQCRPCVFENEGAGIDRLGANVDPPANAAGDRRGPLVDVERERAAVPDCRRPANRRARRGFASPPSSALRHRPERGSRP